ncbi:MAG: hypothetical protein E6J80_05095 [Deltaproteobacteria bacterium]|nr:MAG: hypothetical protein E6J80_05095 [Deltaproteobacteria bacterium]
MDADDRPGRRHTRTSPRLRRGDLDSARLIEGVDTDFGPNSTLQIPSDVVHQIVNTGTEEMFLIAALGQAPVRVCTADNQHMPLPWQAS